MTGSGRVRRLLVAAIVGVAVVTALVLGSVAMVSGSPHDAVLGLDLVAWTVISPLVAVVTVGGVALLVLRVLERRRQRGLAFLDRQVRAMREGEGALPRPLVGLTEVDKVTGDLARKKLMPAIYDLANRGLLPPGFALTGFAALAIAALVRWLRR